MLKLAKKNDICLFCNHDFCKRLEVLLQSCIELNPLSIITYPKTDGKGRVVAIANRLLTCPLTLQIVRFFSEMSEMTTALRYLHSCDYNLRIN
jgi:hypothetical protein